MKTKSRCIRLAGMLFLVAGCAPQPIATPSEFLLAQRRASGCDQAGSTPSARSMRQLDSAVAAGRLAFDAGAAQRCIAAYGEIGCDPAGPSPPMADCAAVFHGLVAPGAICADTRECAGGYCDAASPGCLGLCRAELARGAACGGSTTRCAPEDSCRGGTCRPRSDAGATCDGAGDCADGLYCDATPQEPGACLPQLGLGDRCDPTLHDGACASHFGESVYCDPAAQRCATRPTDGMTCAPPAAGEEDPCAEGSCDPVSRRCTMACG